MTSSTASTVSGADRNGPRTSAAIRDAATGLFYSHGYEATSLRQVAAAVGIQVGSLYNHMAGKEQLLLELMVSVMEDLLASVEAAVEPFVDPLDRLQAGIESHLRYHAEHRREVFVGNSELRALGSAERRVIVALRRRYEDAFRTLVQDAVSAGNGAVLDVTLQVYSILALGTHVPTWYRPGLTGDLDEIIRLYVEILFREMGLRAPASALTGSE